MILALLARLLYAIYFAAPVIAIFRALWSDDRAVRRKRIHRVIGPAIAAVVLTIIVSGVYAWHLRSDVQYWQLVKAAYLMWGLLLWLRVMTALFALLTGGLRRNFPLFGGMIRLILTVVIIVPWAVSAMMAYRVKMSPRFEAMAGFRTANYEKVQFAASDSGRVVAWWIPSLAGAGQDRTVIVVHGLGSNRTNHLAMAKKLYAEGYSVLSIDLRGHGDAGGQICTFGMDEAADVRGAMTWLAAAHPAESSRLYIVAHSMGSAAVIGALAAQPDARVQAVALLSPYDTFASAADDFISSQMLSYSQPLMRYVGLPMLCMHTGRNLYDLRPIDHIAELWPVPVLILHGTRDTLITQTHGRKLFEAATQPKFFVPTDHDHNAVIDDDGVRATISDFFRSARRLPLL